MSKEVFGRPSKAAQAASWLTGGWSALAGKLLRVWRSTTLSTTPLPWKKLSSIHLAPMCRSWHLQETGPPSRLRLPPPELQLVPCSRRTTRIVIPLCLLTLGISGIAQVAISASGKRKLISFLPSFPPLIIYIEHDVLRLRQCKFFCTAPLPVQYLTFVDILPPRSYPVMCTGMAVRSTPILSTSPAPKGRWSGAVLPTRTWSSPWDVGR